MPSTTTLSPQRLRALIAEELPGLIDFRRDLHAHPELQYQETRTSTRVQQSLNERGIPYKAGLARGTGVLAYLPGADDSHALGLRADMDALPITEENDLPYASTNPGVMHACGHDGHTAVCLGAARVLKRISDEIGPLPRSVKFLFQPAEEGGAGGEAMVKDGCLTDAVIGPPVSRMFALHCWPEIPLGQLASKPGPLLAATDTYRITVTGRMSHAAYPHFSNDPIVAAAHIVTALQSIASRNADPVDSIVVSVTQFHAGTAFNVIPESAILAGTMRTLRADTREIGKDRIHHIARSVADAMRCRADIEWMPGYPVTDNHPDATAEFFAKAAAAVGPENARTVPAPSLGGEDFAYYCAEVPSCFFLLGQKPHDVDAWPYVHTPIFNFNDDSIALGVEMFCRLALDLAD